MSRVGAVKKIKGEIVYELEDPPVREGLSSDVNESPNVEFGTMEKPPIVSLLIMAYLVSWPVSVPVTIFALVWGLKIYPGYAAGIAVVATYVAYRYSNKLPLIPNFKKAKSNKKGRKND